MIIDSHHHFWRPARGDYGWLTPDKTVLHRDFEPEHLAPLMAQGGVAGGILVQAAPSHAETDFLLDLADRTATILAVIGWTDFAAPDAADVIAGLAEHRKLKGLRPMLQDLADDDHILSPQAAAALTAVETHRLVFEALVMPRHLPRLAIVRGRHPTLPMVLNHCAKPDIAGGGWEPWASDIRRLAEDGITLCKLSGLITEAGDDWTIDRLRPYADHVIEVFGPSRVMWGSDWPVALLAGGYDQWLATTHALLEGLSETDRRAILCGNAVRCYGLGHCLREDS